MTIFIPWFDPRSAWLTLGRMGLEPGRRQEGLIMVVVTKKLVSTWTLQRVSWLDYPTLPAVRLPDRASLGGSWCMVMSLRSW